MRVLLVLDDDTAPDRARGGDREGAASWPSPVARASAHPVRTLPRPLARPTGPTDPAAPGGVAALLAALGRRGIDLCWAPWSGLEHDEVDLAGIDVLHLWPHPLRAGSTTGDRRRAERRLLAGDTGPDVLGVRVADRRSTVQVLGSVPPGLPVVVTLSRPIDPAGGPAVRGPGTTRTRAAGRGPVPADGDSVPGRSGVDARPGTRPVHVIVEDAVVVGDLAAVLPRTYAVEVALIGHTATGTTVTAAPRDPVPTVLVVTAPGSSTDALAALRAAESVARAGRRLTLVVVGVGPDVRGVAAAAALAEAAGVEVRLLGRATAAEVAGWRATVAATLASPRAAAMLPGGTDLTLEPPRWSAAAYVANLAERLRSALGPVAVDPVASIPAAASPDDVAERVAGVYEEAIRSHRR